MTYLLTHNGKGQSWEADLSADLSHWVQRWRQRHQGTGSKCQDSVPERGAEIIVRTWAGEGRTEVLFWLGIMVKILIEVPFEVGLEG